MATGPKGSAQTNARAAVANRRNQASPGGGKGGKGGGKYARRVGDIRGVYGQSGKFLKHLENRSVHGFNSAIGHQKTVNKRMLRSIGANAGGIRAQGTNQLAALGLTPNGAMNGLRSDAAFATDAARSDGINAISNLRLSRQNAAMMGGLLQGSNQGSMMSDLSAARQAHQKAMAAHARRKSYAPPAYSGSGYTPYSTPSGGSQYSRTSQGASSPSSGGYTANARKAYLLAQMQGAGQQQPPGNGYHP